MTARAFDLPEVSACALTRYRMDVIASSIDDVVRSAGGWLFDRAMAGWEVNLLVSEPADARALRILGISAVPLEPTPAPKADLPRIQAIAVAADVFNTDERIRNQVIDALETGHSEVTLWGHTWPPEFRGRADAVQHRLSAAARAFKACALAAAEVTAEGLIEAETFRTGSRWHAPYEPDLLPIG